MKTKAKSINAASAKHHLQKIIWISILSLVAAYIVGMANFGIVYLHNLSESTTVRIEAKIQEQLSEMLTEVMLDQGEALRERLHEIETSLNQDPHIKNLCIQLRANNLSTFDKSCKTSPKWNHRIEIPVLSGSHELGSLEINYRLVGVFRKLATLIAPIFLLVTGFSMSVIFAIFRSAERTVIGPFAEAVRASEEQAATQKTIRMLAHDVRRPFSMLSIMLGEIEQATTMEQVENLSRRYHQQVQESLHQITHQMNEFLNPEQDLSSRSVVSLNDMIQASIEAIHFIFKDSPSPQVYLPMYPVKALCDLHHMRRVVDNIITNAFEASGEHDIISISLSENDANAFITIHNTGSHIQNEDLAELFSENYTKGKKSGNGLGLAIAKRYIERDQGTISCENRDYGVAFTIQLPKVITTEIAKIPVIKKPPQSLSDADRRKPIRLLIVEDEVIYQDAILLCIERLNQKSNRIIPMLATTSAEALRFAQEWQPHAVICDQNLGVDNLSGLEITSILHKADSNLPVLLLSNGIFDTGSRSPGNKKILTAVQKPIDPGTLELFLRTLRNNDAPSTRSIRVTH